MLDYASRAIDPYVNSLAGFKFTAEAAVADATRDGVRRLEMSFDVRSAGHFKAGFAGFTSFIRKLVERHRDQIDLRPELGIARETIGTTEIEDRAREGIDSGLFVSIDLYGDEDARALDSVTALYARAQSAGMKLKAHVGEFIGAERVRETADVLGLAEIQHGIAAAESTDVMEWLAENRIRLHICPTSNVMLGATTSLKAHPIRVLFDHGVEVTINTDDLMVFGQSVSQEYMNLFKARVFSADELDGIRVASIGA
jgi:adenosine deaminase